MSQNSVPSALERQRMLLSWLEQRRRARLPEIAQEFGVSLATARRDLALLAKAGHIQRVHGGALALRHAPPEAPVFLRSSEQSAEKQRIAATAAMRIKEGETVLLGSGTTVEAVARLLARRRNLTVITNSLLVLNVLAATPGNTLTALGGTLRHSKLSFIGPLTRSALSELRACKVVLGIRAIDADGTKCGSGSTVFVAPRAKSGTLITDGGAPVAAPCLDCDPHPFCSDQERNNTLPKPNPPPPP